jgi:hypothetical protein
MHVPDIVEGAVVNSGSPRRTRLILSDRLTVSRYNDACLYQ